MYLPAYCILLALRIKYTDNIKQKKLRFFSVSFAGVTTFF